MTNRNCTCENCCSNRDVREMYGHTYFSPALRKCLNPPQADNRDDGGSFSVIFGAAFGLIAVIGLVVGSCTVNNNNRKENALFDLQIACLQGGGVWDALANVCGRRDDIVGAGE